MLKNTTGQKVSATLNSLTDGTPVSTGTTTVDIIKDGVHTAGLGTVGFIFGGVWVYNPTQTETDGDHIVFIFSNALAATQSPQIYTISYNPHNVANLGLSDITQAVSDISALNVLSVADVQTLLDGMNDLSVADVQTLLDGMNDLSTVDVQTLLDGMNDLSAAEMKAEVVAALFADPVTEPTSIPASNASIANKLSYLFSMAGNKLSQTASVQTLRNRTDTANISQSDIGADGTTTTRGVHL